MMAGYHSREGIIDRELYRLPCWACTYHMGIRIPKHEGRPEDRRAVRLRKQCEACYTVHDIEITREGVPEYLT